MMLSSKRCLAYNNPSYDNLYAVLTHSFVQRTAHAEAVSRTSAMEMQG